MSIFDYEGMFKPVRNLRKRNLEIGEQIQQLERQRTAVVAAPAAQEDVIDFLERYVERNRGEFSKNLRTSVDSLIRTPLSTQSDKKLAEFSLHGAVPYDDSVPLLPVERTLCAIFPAEMKASLRKAVQEVEWPANAGLRLAARQAAVDEIDQKLEALLKEQREIETRAGEAGIRLDVQDQ